MRLSQYAAAIAALSLVMLSSNVCAQQVGLRLNSQFGIYDNPVGLKLRVVNANSSLFALPAPDTYTAPNDRAVLSNTKTSTSLISDWKLDTVMGLRASAGLVLHTSPTTMFSEEGNAHRRDLLQSSPETYIGLGWSGDPFGTKSWRFSADVGSFVSTRNHSASTFLGIQTDPGNLRWAPYLSVGAQFNY